MNVRTGKEGKQRGMEGEQGKEGLFGEWKDGNYGTCQMGAEGKRHQGEQSTEGKEDGM